MSHEPYKSARRVFWIMDNRSAHRGQKAVASWLTEIEIYFSIVQRKVLTTNDFQSLNELEHRLSAFQRRYEATASPSQVDLYSQRSALLAKIENKRFAPAA